MVGLTDMEELISSVPEKDIATYLREAFICYGAGACSISHALRSMGSSSSPSAGLGNPAGTRTSASGIEDRVSAHWSSVSRIWCCICARFRERW